MSTWANSKFVPGQFTGSTGANILTAKELTSGFQAWAKKVSAFNQFQFNTERQNQLFYQTTYKSFSKKTTKITFSESNSK